MVLINISKKNRLLYSGKINTGFTKDLFYENNDEYNKDILDLIEIIKQKVYEKFCKQIELEIIIIGYYLINLI